MKWSRWVIYTLTTLVVFAQGLYFSEQWLAALLIMGTMVIVSIYRRKEFRWSHTFLSYMLLGYVLLHIVGYISFDEKGMLVFGLLKSCLYLVFYCLLLQLDQEGPVSYIGQAFVASMVFAGYLTTLIFMTGYLPELHYVIQNRGAGPVQYANTYGVLIVVALMMCTEMSLKPWLKFAGIIGLVIPLILTMSRGAFLVAAVVIGLSYLVNRPSKATLFSLGTSIVLGLMILRFFDNSGTALRLTEATGASEWHSRLLYYKDALKMIMDQPLGFGYNGYHYAQSFYQTGSTYHVKFVHSALLQSFLDLGVLGGLWMMAWMFYCVFLGGHTWQQRLMLMAILGHSLVDMNLQFPLVFMLVVYIIIKEGQPLKFVAFKKVGPITVGLVAILVLAGYMTLPVYYFNQKNYEKAIGVYPYYTEAYRKYLSLESVGLDQVCYAQQLEQINPYVVESYPILRDEAISRESFKEALVYSKKMVTYSPLLIEHHEQYSHALIFAATYWHAHGKDEEALLALQEILEIPGVLDKLAKEKNTDYNVKHKPDLSMNPVLMKDYIEASYLEDKIMD